MYIYINITVKDVHVGLDFHSIIGVSIFSGCVKLYFSNCMKLSFLEVPYYDA